jgi:hypothetical protein
VHIRPDSSGTLEFFLTGAAPWEFDVRASFPENCTEKTSCTTANAPALAIGRYEDQQRSIGVATVTPTRRLEYRSCVFKPERRVRGTAVWRFERRHGTLLPQC